jgi:hypothetical protein
MKTHERPKGQIYEIPKTGLSGMFSGVAGRVRELQVNRFTRLTNKITDGTVYGERLTATISSNQYGQMEVGVREENPEGNKTTNISIGWDETHGSALPPRSLTVDQVEWWSDPDSLPGSEEIVKTVRRFPVPTDGSAEAIPFSEINRVLVEVRREQS